MPNDEFASHPIVSHDEWIAERTAFLAKEKEFTRLRDEHARERRALPWERVSKEYVFDGAKGKQTLAELFDGRSQLIVYHFMFAPGAKAGCPHCSLRADGFDGIQPHLNQRDVTMICVSRAPYETLAADREGHSVFVKDAKGDVCHTYSCYDRGNDNLNIHYAYLDMVPKGRDEGGRGPFWVKRRGEYGVGGGA